VLDIQGLVFAYPGHAPIISDFKMTVVGAKRVAISGKNGSGKTTLLKLIMGQLIPTSGTIKVGVQHRAYLDQTLSVLDSDQTILENFRRLNPDVQETDCRLRLATFLFVYDDVNKLVSNLSGGEKMRAALACILMGDTPPQLIMLDEPTNNVDLESIASIEQALANYKGALIVVSHDVTFLQNIGVEETIELTGK
jgi:ATPase subunit of ABC transporter with duplicated ATPase domains